MSDRDRRIYGVGINDADYTVKPRDPVTGKRKDCPYYSRWKGMIKRCYSEKDHKRYPTYKDCTVCMDWFVFSNFKTWMEKQDWKDKDLDKDLLVEGNKVYSDETCVFVKPILNSFILEKPLLGREGLTGSYYNKRDCNFISKCRNPLTKELEYLGLFKTSREAHLKWKARKLELVEELQKEGYINDTRIYEALKLRYS